MDIKHFPYNAVVVDQECNLHRDKGDGKDMLCCIVAAGDFKGEFCIPELGIRVPWKPGHMIFIRSYSLAHQISKWAGDKRFSLVLICPDAVLSGIWRKLKDQQKWRRTEDPQEEEQQEEDQQEEDQQVVRSTSMLLECVCFDIDQSRNDFCKVQYQGVYARDVRHPVPIYLLCCYRSLNGTAVRIIVNAGLHKLYAISCGSPKMKIASQQ